MQSVKLSQKKKTKTVIIKQNRPPNNKKAKSFSNKDFLNSSLPNQRPQSLQKKKVAQPIPKLVTVEPQAPWVNTDRPQNILSLASPEKEEIEAPRDKVESSSNLITMTQLTNAQSSKSNIKVFVRFRPWNEVERDLINNSIGSLCIEYLNEDNKKFKSSHLHTSVKTINKTTNSWSSPYIYDTVFDINAQQKEVYDTIGVDIKNDILSGYNGTIFAYGQSGSGKTFTMYGSDIYDERNCGVIPRLINDWFNHVDKCDDNITFEFKMSFLQIYKEVICDWLTGETHLKIKESPIKGIYVDKLTEVYVDSFENFMGYIDIGQENRYVSETKLNSTSSRSHSILIFEVTQNNTVDNFSKKGALNLVDWAGSEKISKTGAVGETLEEAKKINLSLSALGNVIHSWTSNSEHIPYRDSKLTRILQESWGGNYKTSLVVTCSPHSYHWEETITSLKFAQRVKHIKNQVKVNIKLSYEELQKIIAQLKKALELANGENLSLRELLEKNSIDCKDIVPVFAKLEGKHHTFTALKTGDDRLIKENVNDCDSDEMENSDKQENKKKNNNNNNKKVCFDLDETKGVDIPLVEVENKTCAEHWEIINKLRKKIEILEKDIQEKEEIIATLETSNWKKQKEISNKPIISSIFEPPDEEKEPWKAKTNNDGILGTLSSWEAKYNTIHSMISELNSSKNEPENKAKFTPELFDEEIQKWIHKISAMYETTIFTDFQGYASNWPNNLISNMSNLLKHSLLFPTVSKIDDSLNCIFKDNISSIFDSIFWLNPKSDLNPATMREKLIKFSSLFWFSFTQWTCNNQLSNWFNNLLLTQINHLQKSNLLLINIVDDLLKSNLDISRNLNNASINKFKSSILGEGNIEWIGRDNTCKNTLKVLDGGGFQRNRGKILTVLNKKGRDMMNQLKMRSKNNMLKFNSYKTSFVNVANIKEENDDNLIENDDKDKISNQEEVKKHEEQPEIWIPIPEFSQFEVKQEKKSSKWSMLKEFLIKSLKLTEEHKNNMTWSMDNISGWIKNIEQNLLCKLIEKGILKSEDWEDYTDCKGLLEWDIPLNISEYNSYSNSNYTINHIPINIIPPNKNKKIKSDWLQCISQQSNLQNNNMPFTFTGSNSNNPQNKNQISTAEYSLLANKNKMNSWNHFPLSLANLNQHKLNLSHEIMGNSSNKINNINQKSKKSKGHLQEIMNYYLTSGTATRKFDGISVKMENSKITCVYEGGLNANNRILNNPLGNRVSNNQGDNDDAIIEES